VQFLAMTEQIEQLRGNEDDAYRQQQRFNELEFNRENDDYEDEDDDYDE